MADLKGKLRAGFIKLVGGDESYIADVFNISGANRLAVDANISSINVPLGKDPLPDMYFPILTAGAIGDTIRVQVSATASDSTSPDNDIPAYDYTYTLVAEDAGDEVKLANNLADTLNDDPNFELSFLEATAVDAVDEFRPIVHISSTVFSMNGEFAERPNAGDVIITTTGTTTVLIDNNNDRLVSRAKEVSLARDPNNPHRLGVQNVSGTVRLRASEVNQILKEYLVNGALSDEMAATADSFKIGSNPTGGSDKLVESLKFIISDNNIKVQTGNFLGANSALTNGILVRFVKDGIVTHVEPIIKSTLDILGQWSSNASDNKIINQSGGDYLESNFHLADLNLQFNIEAGKNDYIEVLTQDNLSSRGSIKMLAGGFLE
jgi:hypothetical protein